MVMWLAVAILLTFATGVVANSNVQADDENAACLVCHKNPELKTRLPSGEELSLYVDPEVFNASVHGKQGQKCTACHTNIRGYPHPAIGALDRRDFQLDRYTQCRSCHLQQYELTLDSIHARALAGGDRNAALCTDCHGSHDITPPREPRWKISITCSKCHSTVFNQYKESVHGAVLLEESNPDVPTCIDCHGVHSIEDPLTARFRLKSPWICADCHTDPARMSKYGLSTDVLDSYVADFHGTTVELFVKQSPDQPTNKAVCYDCHGVHNIKKITDPEASVVKENLLHTCRQCHPDATSNFPAAWVGHYRASPERHPLVYYIQLFYKVLIPTVIGFFVLYILLDIARWTAELLKREEA